jgi:nitric oxide reductase NorD protein
MTEAQSESGERELPSSPSRFVRALWGLDVRVRALPARSNEFTPRRPRFMASELWLPASPLRGVPGNFSDYLFAACAHISAHLRFGAPRFPRKSLKPAQIAIISLLEDARVERLAALHYPGLRRLWTPYHQARADGPKTSSALLARLARALHDDAYVDDDSWVNKGRQSFLQARSEWHDSSWCRKLGSALGNDLGQMRVQFNAKDYAVEPAYRDDNVGLWHTELEQTEDGAAFESEGRRSVESSTPAPRQRERGEPQAIGAQECSGNEHASGMRSKVVTEVELSARYGEWDYVIRRERPAFCSIKERLVVPRAALPSSSPLEPSAPERRRLERFALRLASPRAIQERRLMDGDRLDLPAAVATVVAHASGTPPDQRVYRRVRFRVEPPALLLLLDLSESLNSVPPGADATLLELAESASALLATSLESIANDFAIHGFSSNGRHDVGYYRFKEFDEPFDDRVRARLAGMRAGWSTRLGTALRHAGQALSQRNARRKLLLVVTDGEPSDVDVHDPKYLLFDAKQATIANRRLGVTSFCAGLDANAEESVLQIFGPGNYSLLDRLHTLPQRLAQLYLRLSA